MENRSCNKQYPCFKSVHQIIQFQRPTTVHDNKLQHEIHEFCRRTIINLWKKISAEPVTDKFFYYRDKR